MNFKPEFYANKSILAPMVRCGTLPMRLLCLRYGADLVYSPEIIDKRIITAKRVVNHSLNTVDFLSPVPNTSQKHGPRWSLDLRVAPQEKGKLIFQLGTSTPELAVAAARVVMNDVDGIDVNCGCPKKFSLSGGMGALLLEDEERLLNILRALVTNIPLPISCKIRLLPSFSYQDPAATLAPTLALVEKLCQTGISALAVHTRTRRDKYTIPASPCVFSEIAPIVQKYGVTLIANGDVFTSSDIDTLRSQYGITSTMHARAPQANPSSFLCFPSQHRSTPPSSEMLDVHEVVMEYLKLGLMYDMPLANLKFTICCMIDQSKPPGMWVVRSKSVEELLQKFGLEEWYKEQLELRELRIKKSELMDGTQKEEMGSVDAEDGLYHYHPDVVVIPNGTAGKVGLKDKGDEEELDKSVAAGVER